MRSSKGLEIKSTQQEPNQNIFLNRRIVSPEKLKILVLSGNEIVNEQLEFIRKCVNLVKLDLSYNYLTKIAPKSRFADLDKLKILYLHNNRIDSFSGLEGALQIPGLIHLTIAGNPVANMQRAEHLITNMLPNLKVLGDRVIFVEQRSSEMLQARKNVYIEHEIAEGWRNQEKQETYYIKILELQLRYFEYTWYYNNPIIIIQRSWRKAIHRKRQKYKKQKLVDKQSQGLLQSKKAVKNQLSTWLKQYFDVWKDYVTGLKNIKYQLSDTDTLPRDKRFLTYSLQQYLLAQRNFRLQSTLKRYLQRVRERIRRRKMAQRIKKQLKHKQIQFNSHQSFFAVSGIKKSKRFYFSKVQSHLLQNLLAHMSINFNWNQRIQNSVTTGSVTKYLSIRMVDAEAVAAKRIYSTFTYMLWPSMKVVFLTRRRIETIPKKTGMIKIKPLYYIKNKNKVLSSSEIMKCNRIYRAVQRFDQKQYRNCLEYFQCEDDEVTEMLLRYIYYHNCKTYQFPKVIPKSQMQSLLEDYDEPFVIYAEDLVRRTAAAVRIQRNWRKYLVNRNQLESIYTKMKAIRAVCRIQRFWRDNVFYHRLSFQKMMNRQLKSYQGDTILIPDKIYFQLLTVCPNRVNQIFEKLNIVYNRSQNELMPLWAFGKPVAPTYIRFLNFDHVSFSNGANDEIQGADAYRILHLNSQVCIKEYRGHKFMQFRYNSVSQCQYRVYLLALLSYRMKGSIVFLPLPAHTSHTFEERFKFYYQQGFLKNYFNDELTTDFNGFGHNCNKVTTQTIIEKQGMFLFDGQPNPKPSKKSQQISVEFYQKVFRDYPKKYITKLFYTFLDNQCVTEQVKEKQTTDKIEQSNQDMNQTVKSIDSELNQEKTIEQQPKQQFQFIEAKRVDKKRQSMYDVGSKTGSDYRREKQLQYKLKQFANTAKVRDAKVFVSKTRERGVAIRKEINEKKKANLTQIKSSVKQSKRQQRDAANIQQIERNQTIMSKVEKVKEFHSRLRSSKRSSEQGFIQQGNFVMQQQLKMVIMKNKAQTVKVRIKHHDLSEAQSRSKRTHSFYADSEKSELKERPYDQSIAVPQKNGTEQFQGGESEIVHTRFSSKKNRTHSIGAYLRDTSYVHGVFPEEYYPIQSKGSNFKLLPPL